MTVTPPLRLGVNIDHVATLRNARGGAHPSPLRAAEAAVAAGADGITVHLREDRRHIRDADVDELLAALSVPLNLEMAVTDEMVAIAVRHRPHAVCLVPERRQEVTTEGGLNVAAELPAVARATQRLAKAGCRVSLFIDPDPAQVEAAAKAGAHVVELHTGRYCEHREDPAEYERLRRAAALAASLKLECHAGHGLDYETGRRVAAMPEIVELNIGHFMIGEAVFEGLTAVVTGMIEAMRAGRGDLASASGG